MKTLLFIFSIVFSLIYCSACSSIDDSTFVSDDSPELAVTSTDVFLTTVSSTSNAWATSTPSCTPFSTPIQPINHTPTNTVTPPTSTLLHTLYFLADSQDESQVWRLGTDGSSKQQMTHEKINVDEFAVSPVDGRMAFISDNRLFLIDNDGENRSPIADGHTVDQNVEDYYFRSNISSPVFSPDGRKLAYGFNGLHIYDIATGKDDHVLTNLGNLLGEPFVYSKEVYVPGTWSPDGSLLLIIMSYYEGSTLAVMEAAAEQPFRRLRSNGPVCCIFNWADDGNSLLVANPYYTVDLPGLWRFDTHTGVQSVVLEGLEENGSINFVGWPMQLDNGDLLFFHVNLEKFSPDVGIPLTMVRSDPNGMFKKQVRSEIFHIRDVLWVQDGSAAVILQSGGDNGKIQIVLARTDKSPVQVLFEAQRLSQLMWGP